MTTKIPPLFDGSTSWFKYKELFVVEDHCEEHVDLGGSRLSESSLERWRHVIVPPLNVVILEC